MVSSWADEGTGIPEDSQAEVDQEGEVGQMAFIQKQGFSIVVVLGRPQTRIGKALRGKITRLCRGGRSIFSGARTTPAELGGHCDEASGGMRHEQHSGAIWAILPFCPRPFQWLSVSGQDQSQFQIGYPL